MFVECGFAFMFVKELDFILIRANIFISYMCAFSDVFINMRVMCMACVLGLKAL